MNIRIYGAACAENRESGVNPERSHHCNRGESATYTKENPEGIPCIPKEFQRNSVYPQSSCICQRQILKRIPKEFFSHCSHQSGKAAETMIRKPGDLP